MWLDIHRHIRPGTGSGYCDGGSTALHTADVPQTVSLAYKLQCANVGNLICVVVVAQCDA